MLLFIFQSLESLGIDCNQAFPTYSFVTGDYTSALSVSAVYRYSSTDQDVYLNKLQAGTTGKYTFLHIGTSDGKLYKVSQIINMATSTHWTPSVYSKHFWVMGQLFGAFLACNKQPFFSIV